MLQFNHSRILSVCLILFASTASYGDDWPQFRGPGGQGISKAENLPMTWSETENIAWKTARPGYGASSPIALNGRLYLTCYSGYGIERDQPMADLRLHVVCIDGSGDVTATHRLWTNTSGSNVSSPVIHDGYLYWMHEQRGIAFCAKASRGQLVYEQRLEGARQVYASALLAEGRLYYVARNGETFVLAARPEFEQLAHNTLADRSTFNASPIVCDGKLILRSDENLYAIAKIQ